MKHCEKSGMGREKQSDARELKCFGKEKPSDARELNRDGKAANLTDSEKLS